MAGVPLRPVVVLGATGSIGTQALDVAARLDIPVAGLAARRASRELLTLAGAHVEASVAVAEPGEGRQEFRSALGSRVSFGPHAVADLAAAPGATILNGIVGAAGLVASLTALEAGNRLALANKESLVAGGSLVIAARDRGGGELIPVDSEHSAIWQCLVGEPPGSVRRLILTASGGPFRGRSVAGLAAVTPADALAHPTWKMGPRITVDSATLMNKAFEVIEAHYLFEADYDDIDVVIHPQSYVHSIVEFGDGVLKAEIGPPDMRKPIQYALTAPDRGHVSASTVEPAVAKLVGIELTFEAPDRVAFPCLELGYEAGRRGGNATAVLNAADEEAVAAFLDARLPFSAIAEIVAASLEIVPWSGLRDIDDVIAADRAAREAARSAIADLARSSP
jgi:1-deoxy-D-xylulose-5-phosphate reductoisomerase